MVLVHRRIWLTSDVHASRLYTFQNTTTFKSLFSLEKFLVNSMKRTSIESTIKRYNNNPRFSLKTSLSLLQTHKIVSSKQTHHLLSLKKIISLSLLSPSNGIAHLLAENLRFHARSLHLSPRPILHRRRETPTPSLWLFLTLQPRQRFSLLSSLSIPLSLSFSGRAPY